jgi:hypothetical protein
MWGRNKGVSFTKGETAEGRSKVGRVVNPLGDGEHEAKGGLEQVRGGGGEVTNVADTVSE